ncbi:hypothetical protein DIPPA_33476 [Diplonema papillatum]|nr:hypothetical protein DIPPA_33476 [Diplonema papillatum]
MPERPARKRAAAEPPGGHLEGGLALPGGFQPAPPSRRAHPPAPPAGTPLFAVSDCFYKSLAPSLGGWADRSGSRQFLDAAPWVPAGKGKDPLAAASYYPSEFTADAAAGRKMEKTACDAVVHRLHEESLRRKSVLLDGLLRRYCSDPRKSDGKKPRTLTADEMDRQYNKNVAWEQRVKRRLDMRYAPAPPPKPKSGKAADRDDGESPSYRRDRSVSRLYKGAGADGVGTDFFTSRDRLYVRHGVAAPPATVVHTAKGPVATYKLTKDAARDSVDRLYTQSLATKNKHLLALRDKHVTAADREFPARSAREWTELVKYLAEGGPRPEYRTAKHAP